MGWDMYGTLWSDWSTKIIFCLLASCHKTREFRKQRQPALEDCHGDGKWAPLRDVFGRVTKSYLENLVELSPELMKVIEMGITCRATCGFDGVSEQKGVTNSTKYLLKFADTVKGLSFTPITFP